MPQTYATELMTLSDPRCISSPFLEAKKHEID